MTESDPESEDELFFAGQEARQQAVAEQAAKEQALRNALAEERLAEEGKESGATARRGAAPQAAAAGFVAGGGGGYGGGYVPSLDEMATFGENRGGTLAPVGEEMNEDGKEASEAMRRAFAGGRTNTFASGNYPSFDPGSGDSSPEERPPLPLQTPAVRPGQGGAGFAAGHPPSAGFVREGDDARRSRTQMAQLRRERDARDRDGEEGKPADFSRLGNQGKGGRGR